MAERRSTETVRLLAVTVLWSLTFHTLTRHGVDLLPSAVACRLSLEEYLALAHVVTLGVGLTLSRVLLAEPRRSLALPAPRPRVVATVLLLAPAVFAATTTIAFLVARPTLLAELIEGGRQAVQKNSGQFGRELVQSPAGLALVWGAVVSPIGEEVFFRGALWSLVQRIVDASWKVPAASPAVPGVPELPLERSALMSALSSAVTGSSRWLRAGGAATLGVATLFGLLHRDMPGGLGIVRFVAATGLGLACGLVRQASGTVLAPVLLHVAFNALSIATVRRWVVTDYLPMKWGAPTATWGLAVLGIAGILLLRVLGPRTVTRASRGHIHAGR